MQFSAEYLKGKLLESHNQKGPNTLWTEMMNFG